MVEERRVRIPKRWISGLGEVQALQSAMTPVLTATGAEAFRFFRSLPRSGTGRAPAFVAGTASGIRLAHAQTRGGVRLVGAERLRALEAPAREATRELGVDESVAAAGLARLAAAGLVGYDLAEDGYFYRAIPIGRTDPAARLPRLVGARDLVDAGRVTIERSSENGTRAVVRGRDGDYLVSIDGDAATCTCAWFAKHRLDRGPCRHVLAVAMLQAG